MRVIVGVTVTVCVLVVVGVRVTVGVEEGGGVLVMVGVAVIVGVSLGGSGGGKKGSWTAPDHSASRYAALDTVMDAGDKNGVIHPKWISACSTTGYMRSARSSVVDISQESKGSEAPSASGLQT